MSTVTVTLTNPIFLWTFWLKDSNPTFLHDTPPHDDAQPYQVWLQNSEWFKRCLLDKTRQMNTVIPAHFVTWGTQFQNNKHGD